MAHAELQQAADVAAASMERGGDAPAAYAHHVAKANGAKRVTVSYNATRTRATINVWRKTKPLLGAPSGIQIYARATSRDLAIGRGYSGLPGSGETRQRSAGKYDGELIRIDAALACPAVANSYLAMQAAARRGGVSLWAVSGFRSHAEQAILFARLGPRIAAPPGVSRHHDSTELDISTGSAGSTVHRWLLANGPAFGFHQRYSWESRLFFHKICHWCSSARIAASDTSE